MSMPMPPDTATARLRRINFWKEAPVLGSSTTTTCCVSGGVSWQWTEQTEEALTQMRHGNHCVWRLLIVKSTALLHMPPRAPAPSATLYPTTNSRSAP